MGPGAGPVQEHPGRGFQPQPPARCVRTPVGPGTVPVRPRAPQLPLPAEPEASGPAHSIGGADVAAPARPWRARPLLRALPGRRGRSPVSPRGWGRGRAGSAAASRGAASRGAPCRAAPGPARWDAAFGLPRHLISPASPRSDSAGARPMRAGRGGNIGCERRCRPGPGSRRAPARSRVPRGAAAAPARPASGGPRSLPAPAAPAGSPGGTCCSGLEQ